MVKNPPANVGDRALVPDPLEEEMATHSSILAWEIPGTEQPAGLQCVGSHRARHELVSEHSHF